MKVRMIFGTFVEIEGERVELKCDTTPDVPDEVAFELLKGRAEPVDPLDPVYLAWLGEGTGGNNDEKPLEEMKATELINYAADQGLDIGGLVPQAGREKILEAVKAAIDAKGKV